MCRTLQRSKGAQIASALAEFLDANPDRALTVFGTSAGARTLHHPKVRDRDIRGEVLRPELNRTLSKFPWNIALACDVTARRVTVPSPVTAAGAGPVTHVNGRLQRHELLFAGK